MGRENNTKSQKHFFKAGQDKVVSISSHFYQQLTKHTSLVVDKFVGSSLALHFPILYVRTHFTEFSASFAKTDKKWLREY